MTVNRLTVILEQPEYTGLLKIAVKELRDPRDQLRHILRQRLEKDGLLTIDNAKQLQQNGKGVRCG